MAVRVGILAALATWGVCPFSSNFGQAQTASSQQAPAQPATSPASSPQALRVVVFYSSQCQQCQRVQKAIEQAQELWGDRIRVEYHDIAEVDQFSQLFTYADHYKSAAQAPTRVYVGDQCVEDSPQIAQELQDVIAAQLSAGRATYQPPANKRDASDVAAALSRRSETFSMAAVATAGLLDGINPCAFTTIVFLLSMLTYLGKSRHEVATVGIGFVVAVFLTYLLLGLGMFSAIKTFAVSRGIAQGISWGVGLLALALGAWSFVDAIRYLRTKDLATMTLGLPRTVKSRIHKVIRRGLSTGSLLAGAFTVGVLVALLESLCTGQVYLPTITFVIQTTGASAKAIGLLLLYNLMFIAPLVLILCLAYSGVKSDRIGNVLRRHVFAVKLTMAFLFVGLGLLVLATS